MWVIFGYESHGKYSCFSVNFPPLDAQNCGKYKSKNVVLCFAYIDGQARYFLKA